MHRAMRKTAPPNRRRRFSRKTGFGEHEEAQSRSARKIFFLPKAKTQSPRITLSAGLDKSDDVGRASIAECTSNENTCSTVASCELTIVGVAFSHVTCISARMHCCVADEPASRALAPVRQHFLKWDSVFFDVLVYSGCSAFRFPSARSNKAISLTSGGQHGQES